MARMIRSKSGWTGWLLPRCLGGLLLLQAGAAMAAVAQTPLFLAQPPKPNIMFTLDNSGSMLWDTVTGADALAQFNSSKNLRAFYSSTYNQIYYNPETTYTPGVDYKGVSMGDSAPSNARIDPYPTSGGTTSKIDLTKTCFVQDTTPLSVTLPLYSTSNFSATTNFASCYERVTTSGSGRNQKTYDKEIARYAFYYTWRGAGSPNGTSGQDNDTNYLRVDILPGRTYPKSASRTDCGTAPTCTYAQELQNFANWFSYYRTRILMTKTSIGLAFAPIDPIVTPVNPSRFRVGFNAINKPGSTNSNSSVSDDAGWLTIRDFDTGQKQDFYTKLYAINPNGGTPLREQMDRVGKLYDGSLSRFDYTNNDPYRESAASSSLTSCRPSYHIMSTDGYWNGGAGSFPTSSSLADIAEHYYTTDLRPGLGNNIRPTNNRDTATWQHMTTFTIGLGADGTIPYSETDPTSWPKAVADSPTAIDDLWHAAVVGKGRYFSAKNPVALQAGLSAVLKDISIQAGAGASGAVTGSVVDGDSYFYVPSFESGKWIGHLRAYDLDAEGAVGDIQWDAADLVPAPASRNIATWNPDTGTGTNFVWDNLTADQKTALTSSDVLDYLRGVKVNEETEFGGGPGIYRYRASKLGDIVNSAPLYVKKSDFGYRVLPTASGGGSAYTTFVNNKANRTPMIYVGANDGMLHAFNANTGVEKFAYVPNVLYPTLVSLSSPDYGHNYYVDGSATEGDAYLGGGWKTIMLGSVGAGGAGVFAINVTDPDSLTPGKVLWEKGSGDLADLGRVMGQVTAVRLRNGTWAAIFGNGYDSASGKAVLYVLDLSTGALIRSIELTGVDTTNRNGLSAPALLFNAQRELVGAYAGDMKGNLWKFDFDSTTSASWTATNLFSAVNADNKVQPMVKRPAIAAHPLGGYLVTVATGKFVDTDDKANVDVQSIYGIWDKPTAGKVTGRSQLVRQTLTSVTGGRKLSNNLVDWDTKRGWYVDLSLLAGERVIGDLTVIDNQLIIATTLAPTSDLCAGGGISQLMAVGYLTGGAVTETVFTVNGVTYTGLSSVEIAGTVANPTWVSTRPGRRVGLSNRLDGGSPQEIGLKTGVQPFRTWHQLILK